MLKRIGKTILCFLLLLLFFKGQEDLGDRRPVLADLTDTERSCLKTDGWIKKLLEEDKAAGKTVRKKLTKAEKSVLKAYKNAKKKNKNVAGWIKIPNTVIDYPIMYSGDNDYYLKHDTFGNGTANGAIFLDQGTGGSFQEVSFIHGHNLKSGRQFGSLPLYKKEDYANKHKVLLAADKNGVKTYRVFTVFLMEGSEILPIEFLSTSDFQIFKKEIAARSQLSLGAAGEGNVLLLNTCSYEFYNAHLIVGAIEKVRKDD